MIGLLRSIKKLVFDNVLTASFTKWRVDTQDLDSSATILFLDGLVGIDASAKVWVNQFQKTENYALLVKSQSDLVKKYELKTGDVFVGRDGNYILFRNGNITIKSDQLNIDCNAINITVTNAVTINEVPLTFAGDKMLVNSKEVAVVGGDIDTATKKITTSGQ